MSTCWSKGTDTGSDANEFACIIQAKFDEVKRPCLWLAAPLDKSWMLQPCGGNLLNLGMTAGLARIRQAKWQQQESNLP
jgi:hypothetical protein